MPTDQTEDRHGDLFRFSIEKILPIRAQRLVTVEITMSVESPDRSTGDSADIRLSLTRDDAASLSQIEEHALERTRLLLRALSRRLEGHTVESVNRQIEKRKRRR